MILLYNLNSGEAHRLHIVFRSRVYYVGHGFGPAALSGGHGAA
jgi:hypothetical protein